MWRLLSSLSCKNTEYFKLSCDVGRNSEIIFSQLKKNSHLMEPKNSNVPHSCSLEMPKDELPNHNCIKHLRTVVQQQQTKISELEKTVAEHKHQLGEQVRTFVSSWPLTLS